MRDAMADQHDDAQPEEEPMRDAVMGAGGQQEPAVARPWVDSTQATAAPSRSEGGDRWYSPAE